MTSFLSPNAERPWARLAAGQGAQRFAAGVALTFLLSAFWAVMHRYAGLTRDARIYAFQALSRLHPNLATDLYLQNTSQDHYTIFSPLYAWFIGNMGLENSALLLTMTFTLWFMAAAWVAAERVGSYELAWASVALLIFTTGGYGALRVFHFPEVYLSARLPAYALIATALALHLRGRRRWGFGLAAAAMLVHPIMALPGVLLLLCLNVGVRVSLIGAVAGILFTVGVAAAAALLPAVGRIVTVIDPAWLEVVRERSEFLFLQIWSAKDWQLNARPFLSLAVTTLALRQTPARDLAMAAALVGAAGLAVAWIGGAIGPIALIIQGQAWRWVWITSFVAVLLLPGTVTQVWREKCGPLCAMFLVLAWTFDAVDGTACAGVALLLLLLRRQMTERIEHYLRLAAMLLAVVILTWIAATAWNVVVSAAAESGREPAALTKLRNILGLEISATLLFGALLYGILRSRSITVLVAVSAVSLTASAATLRKSLEQITPLDSPAYVAEFADWRAVIPDTSTVFVAPAQDTSTFVWFSLQRPNYLAVDQSAGAVFSRATAVEVRRRSDVLLPAENPANWRLMTYLALMHDQHKTAADFTRPLTLQSLTSLCRDPVLGFVVSKDIPGADPVKRMDHGQWKNWGLYDCRTVRP